MINTTIQCEVDKHIKGRVNLDNNAKGNQQAYC
jgi:hypothetical protein